MNCWYYILMCVFMLCKALILVPVPQLAVGSLFGTPS